MTWLLAGLALAQTPPCDDPPPEVTKCSADTKKADANRTMDLSALLGKPAVPAAAPCARTAVTVVKGLPVGVEDRIASLDASLTRCANEAKSRHPELTGAASFELTVDAQGRVSGVGATASTLDDEALAGCVEKVLATARFSAAARVVQVDLACPAPKS